MHRIFKDNAAPFWQLLHYIRPFRREYTAATIYSVLNKVFDLMPEVLLGIAVNTVVEREHSWLATFGVHDLKVQLLLLGVMTMIVYGLESLFEYLYRIKWGYLAQYIQHNFRVDAFNHVQQSTMEAFSRQKTGNVLAILNEDINQLERFFKEDIDEIIELVCTVLFVGGIFIFLSPQIALFTMLPIPLILQGVFFFHRKLGPLYLAVREQAGVVSTQLANSLLGWFTVKSLVGGEIEAEKVTQVSSAYREANLDAIWWEALVGPVIRFAILLGYLVTLVYGGFLAIEGHLDVGAYSTLIFMTQRLLWPFFDTAEVISGFQKTMASTKRLMKIMQLSTEKSPTTVTQLRGGISFSSVSFAYQEATPVLKELSFNIPPKQTVAFVGATGAGKSTLLKLLLGFHVPTAGEICFDGHALPTLSLSGLRSQIGFVSQAPFLFEGTILDNIRYAYPEASDEDVVAAAQQAAADEFIMRFPQGYATWIGERGQTLSGGQMQRIAIARALVRRPTILVLDEATSAVDNETELAIQQTLAQIGQTCTVIIIAHRLSTIKQANQIFVLQHGTIVEQGNHHDLLQQDLFYAHLWRLQTGEHSMRQAYLQ